MSKSDTTRPLKQQRPDNTPQAAAFPAELPRAPKLPAVSRRGFAHLPRGFIVISSVLMWQALTIPIFNQVLRLLHAKGILVGILGGTLIFLASALAGAILLVLVLVLLGVIASLMIGLKCLVVQKK